MADYHCYMGLINQEIDNNENAIYHFKSLMKIGEKTNNIRWIADAKVNLGSINMHGENYSDALIYFNEALVQLSLINNTESQGWCHNHLGFVNSKLGNFEKALDHFNQAEAIWTSNNMERGLCFLYDSKGELYLNIDLNLSYENYKKAYDCALDQGTTQLILPTLYHLGIIYERQNNLDTALSYYSKTYESSIKENDLVFKDLSTNHLATLYKKMNDQANYLKYLELNQTFKNDRFAKKNLEYRRWLTTERELQNLEKETEIANLNHYHQKNKTRFVSIGLLVLFIISIWLIILAKQKIQLSKKLKIFNREISKNLSNVEIQSKELEIQNQSLNSQKRELSNQLLSKLTIISNTQKKIKKLSEEVSTSRVPLDKYQKLIESIKKDFNQEFLDKIGSEMTEVHENLFHKLVTMHPNLTSHNLRLISFIKINLSSKEIAELLNISPSSVKVAKNRLKKKMKLSSEDSLTSYIHSIEF